MDKARILLFGSGPSSLHFCKSLFKKVPDQVTIDMIESRPLLGGLLRYGVAPDHFQIKQILPSSLESLLPHFGNLRIFSNLQCPPHQVQALSKFYHRVFFANGCNSIRPISIPGEEQVNTVMQAFDFVRFYNGDYLLHEDPSRVLIKHQTQVNNLRQMMDMKKAKTIVIVGNGNVSLDISRVISRDWDVYRKLCPDEFRSFTDPRFFEWLERNQFQRIVVLGRRGVMQSGFSLAEFRELVQESRWRVKVLPEEVDLSLNPESLIEMNTKRDIANRPVILSTSIVCLSPNLP